MPHVETTEYDPELAAIIPGLVAVDMRDLHTTRERVRGLRAAGDEADELLASRGFTTRDVKVPARSHTSTIPVRVYSPPPVDPSPAIIFIHGGAFAFGDLEIEHIKATRLAVDCDATVVSVDYRLAPEHKYPAGLDDCDDVLNWVTHNASQLLIDPTRIAIAGTSAGGALAAALVLRNRDTHGPRIAFQLLTYPTLDSTSSQWSAQNYVDTPGWDAVNNAEVWPLYLPDGLDVVPAYASPSAATNLSGLPPTLVLTAEFDPLRDEAVDYAHRLEKSGVPVELVQTRRTFHGFETSAYSAAVTQEAIKRQTDAVRSALHGTKQASLA